VEDVYVVFMVGLPLLGFIYYLEYKKRMYLLEKYGLTPEPAGHVLERRLTRGIFLLLAGGSMVFSPNIAAFMGMEASLTFEMLVIGAVIICAGLAMILGCIAVVARKNLFLNSTDPLKTK
jgi:hypothetical protein